MLRLERTNAPVDVQDAILEGHQAGIWTALPVIIESFDPDAMTCTAQPAIRAQIRDEQNAWHDVTLPLLVDVPVVFPSGGGYTLTFPIAEGDEALVVFSSRCIDAWWQSGGVQNQAELRMHDLSDGFALVGPRSQVRVLPNVSTASVQLRSDDGSAYVEINGTQINAVSTTEVKATAPNVTVNASSEIVLNTPILKVSGDIIDNYGSNAYSMSQMRSIHYTHTHGGVTAGSANTAIPNQTE